jgi:RNA polymerase sigma-70 factor (ECF subfamily)
MEDADVGIAMPLGAATVRDEAQTGEAMLEELYDQYAAGLFRYALALVGSAEDAEDAVQEVWVRLAREHGRLRRIGSMRAYLFAAVRNAAWSILRSRRRRNEVHVEDFDAEPSTMRVECMALRECFAGLPVEQREVLALKVYEGMTFNEIARTVAASINTVASRYRYAIERLRKSLEEPPDG